MRKLLFVLVLTGLFSCKTKEVIKTEYVQDSTAVTELVQKVQELENEKSEYLKKLDEQVAINELLQATTSVVVERYDTDKPDIPLKEKVFVNRSESSQKESRLNREETGVMSKEKERVHNENSLLKEKVDVLEKEKIKINKESKPKIQWWLILIGFLTGTLTYYYGSRFFHM